MKTLLTLIMLVPIAVWAQNPIGHRNITFIDSSRSNRQVPTDVYYPATTSGDNTPFAAPPADGFPVISFGHGFLLNVATYQYLWEALVPEGYIMALPRTEGNLSPNHLQLGLDLAFLIETLKREGATEGSPFYGAIAQTSGVMGHSMGGGASFLAAQSDTTITAISNFAAAETNPSAIAAAAVLSIPALVFSGSDDCVAPPASHQIPMYNALNSTCKTYITLTGGSHCKFGENNFICNLGETGCPGSLSRAEQQALVTYHLLPFLNYTLKDEPQARCLFQERLEAAVGITYDQDCTIPAVQDLTIYPSDSGVILNWSPVPAACSYELLRSDQPGFTYDPEFLIYQGIDTTFEDTVSTEHAFYQVWVR